MPATISSETAFTSNRHEFIAASCPAFAPKNRDLPPPRIFSNPGGRTGGLVLVRGPAAELPRRRLVEHAHPARRHRLSRRTDSCAVGPHRRLEGRRRGP